jgi:rare lipoprotein A
MRKINLISVLAIVGLLSGCSTVRLTNGSNEVESEYDCEYSFKKGKGYYLDDGPENPTFDINKNGEPIPKKEKLISAANRPYKIFGNEYSPKTKLDGSVQIGYGSWYGTKYNGKKTSSGETYDMFKMTAASPILPILSYARVTNLENNRSVVVRVNDRGPFLGNRIIDLSFLAACRLDYVNKGTAKLKVESIIP